jgi:hypothetical protein
MAMNDHDQAILDELDLHPEDCPDCDPDGSLCCGCEHYKWEVGDFSHYQYCASCAGIITRFFLDRLFRRARGEGA